MMAIQSDQSDETTLTIEQKGTYNKVSRDRVAKVRLTTGTKEDGKERKSGRPKDNTQ